MKTKVGWQQHLIDIVGTSLDLTIYAVQWAHDPRCLQSGASHRRVGALAQSTGSMCPLWAGKRDRG